MVFSFSRADEVQKELTYDRVIACTGFRFDASIFEGDARPELVINDRFPNQTSAWESTNVPGLYIAGTLSQVRDFKKSTNGFIHGFRYGVRALGKILDQRYENQEWPSRGIEATPEAITGKIIERINRTSALWQQFDVLADVVTVQGGQGVQSLQGGQDAQDGRASYLEEVPVAYFKDGGIGSPEHAFLVTLEYGPDHDKVDPFDITVTRIAQDTPGQAHDAAYLHPVVRHYRDGELAGTHHLAENLENEWDRPAVHVEPLIAFVKEQLGAR